MRPIGRLFFDGWVPPQIEQKHVIGGREVQAHTASLEAEQQDVWTVRTLEFFHDAGSVARASVQTTKAQVVRYEVWFEQVEKARPLGENQRLVAIGNDFVQRRAQDFHFG